MHFDNSRWAISRNAKPFVIALNYLKKASLFHAFLRRLMLGCIIQHYNVLFEH